MHPGQTAGGGTHAAQFSRWGLGRRSIPGKQPVTKPTRRSAGDPSRLTASLRAAHRCVSVEIHPGQFSRWGSSLTRLVSRASRPHREDWPTSALTRVPPPAVTRVAARRSSLRFGRNTPGPVLPVGAPLSRALSAGRLAPTGRTGQPRRSPGFHHRLLPAPLRGALRCVSVEIHSGQFSRWGLLPHAPCQPDPHRENWASPLSALTRVPLQAVN